MKKTDWIPIYIEQPTREKVKLYIAERTNKVKTGRAIIVEASILYDETNDFSNAIVYYEKEIERIQEDKHTTITVVEEYIEKDDIILWKDIFDEIPKAYQHYNQEGKYVINLVKEPSSPTEKRILIESNEDLDSIYECLKSASENFAYDLIYDIKYGWFYEISKFGERQKLLIPAGQHLKDNIHSLNETLKRHFKIERI